jgi:hypothetical protein
MVRTGDAPSHFLSRPERKCEGAQWQFAPSAALALLNAIAYIKQCSYAVVRMIPITAATHIPRCRHLAWDECGTQRLQGLCAVQPHSKS